MLCLYNLDIIVDDGIFVYVNLGAMKMRESTRQATSLVYLMSTFVMLLM